MPLSTRFLFHNGFFFSFLCLLDVAYFELSPIVTRFQPFLPILHPSFRRIMGNVAILHHGDPEKAGVMRPFRPHVGPRGGKGYVAMLSDKGSWSIYIDCFWGKHLRGTQGRPELCFGNFSPYGEANRPLSPIQPSSAIEETVPIFICVCCCACHSKR